MIQAFQIAAIVSALVITTIRDQPMSLGRSDCQSVQSAVPVSRCLDCAEIEDWPVAGMPLVLGVDYAIDLPTCEVQALREIPGLVRFAFSYDDHSEELAAEVTAIEQDHQRLRDQFATYVGWLDTAITQSATVRAGAQAIVDAPNSDLDSIAELRGAVRQLAQGLANLALHTERLATIDRRELRSLARIVGGADVPADTP